MAVIERPAVSPAGPVRCSCAGSRFSDRGIGKLSRPPGQRGDDGGNQEKHDNPEGETAEGFEHGCPSIRNPAGGCDAPASRMLTGIVGGNSTSSGPRRIPLTSPWYVRFDSD